MPLLCRGANTSLGWRLSTLMWRTPLLAKVVVSSGKDERHPVSNRGHQMHETRDRMRSAKRGGVGPRADIKCSFCASTH